MLPWLLRRCSEADGSSQLCPRGQHQSSRDSMLHARPITEDPLAAKPIMEDHTWPDVIGRVTHIRIEHTLEGGDRGCMFNPPNKRQQTHLNEVGVQRVVSDDD